MDGTPLIPIEMPLGDWLVVDGEMDHAGALSRHEFSGELYDPRRSARADAVRQLGWDATGHITRPIAEAGRWPPDEDALRTRVTVSLTRADWEFVVAELRRGAAAAAGLGNDRDGASAVALADRIGRIAGSGSDS